MTFKHSTYFLNRFIKLRTATVAGKKAPHKPILLLSIIQSIDEKEIRENKIYITPMLVARFRENWMRLVNNSSFTPNFSLPFFHLRSEGFWHLKTFLGREILLTSSHSIKSFSHLKEVIDYAYFDSELFELMMSEEGRQSFKEALLKHYFGIVLYTTPYELSLVAEVENEILQDAPATYKVRAQSFDEEEVFIRGGIFKKVVPHIYNYSCCISGMRIVATTEVQMIDACHIIPFSSSHDDTISNGISLCPNLHRAFDRGLIAIDENYRVLVSGSFLENAETYSIKNFEGKPIQLPQKESYLPSVVNLKWHKENKFIY